MAATLLSTTKTYNILLADDDKDDCLFFSDVLSDLPAETTLTIVKDGEQLMSQLANNIENLPEVLFLDLNMPRKNGYECLIEIKSHSLFKKIPVVVFSTSYDEEKANQLYEDGAHYYICKPTNFRDLQSAIQSALQLIQKSDARPTKQDFLITKLKSLLR